MRMWRVREVRYGLDGWQEFCCHWDRMRVVDYMMPMGFDRPLGDQRCLHQGLHDLDNRFLHQCHVCWVSQQRGWSCGYQERRCRCVHHVVAVGLDNPFRNELADDRRENASTLHCGNDRQQRNNLQKGTFRRNMKPRNIFENIETTRASIFSKLVYIISYLKNCLKDAYNNICSLKNRDWL